MHLPNFDPQKYDKCGFWYANKLNIVYMEQTRIQVEPQVIDIFYYNSIIQKFVYVSGFYIDI